MTDAKVIFSERQPCRSPAILPALYTEVDAGELRYRTHKRQPWRRVALADIEQAEVGRTGRYAWPVQYRLGFAGEQEYYAASGKAVRLRLRGGQVLTLGTAKPQELLVALDWEDSSER